MRGIAWLFFLVAASTAFVILLRAGSPHAFEFGAEAQVAREAAYALEDCLYLFQEIGEILAEGGTPDAAMRCPGSAVDNIISREGDGVRVSHATPSVFGLRELYVTDTDHEPVVVR